MPKSMISACSSSPIMMLAGLRSRCTTPASCAAARPDATWRAISSARRHRQLPSRLSTRREVVALDVRHRDVLDAVDLAEIVNADDVLVRDLAGEQQLALEAPLDFLRRPRIGDRFRAGSPSARPRRRAPVPRLVDRAHAADPEQPDDVIARAEGLARRERTGMRLADGYRRQRAALCPRRRRSLEADGNAGRSFSRIGTGSDRFGAEALIILEIPASRGRWNVFGSPSSAGRSRRSICWWPKIGPPTGRRIVTLRVPVGALRRALRSLAPL